MSAITIENSPITKTINYRDCIIVDKKNLTQWLKDLKNKFYNSEFETYWSFEWEEAISFLKILDYENRLS
jgi:hypothetical protein